MADTSIGEYGSASGQIRQSKGLAVSAKEGGDVYVADGQNHRIDQFTSSGQFVRAFGWGVVPGAAIGTGDLVAGSTSVTAVTTTSGSFGGQPFEGSGKIVTGTGISADTRIEKVTDTELKLSKPANATVTGATLTVAEAPGNVPTNERKLLSITGPPTQGTFTLTFRTPNPFSTGNTVGDSFAATASFGSSVLTEVTATSGHGDTQEGSTVVESPTATTGAFEVGQMVTGPGIPSGAVIVKTGASFFTMSAKATATANGVALTVKSFLAPGQTVAGSGIPPETTIESIGANGDITLSANATASGSGVGLTAGIPYNATAPEMQSLLEALPNIGAGNVAVAGAAGGPWTIEFIGKYADTTVGEPTETFPEMFANVGRLTPSSTATLSTVQRGSDGLETCTSVCWPGLVGPDPIQLGLALSEIGVDNDPESGSYGDLYVVDSTDYRIEKFGPAGEFLLTFGGEVNKTKVEERKEEEANAEPITITAEEEDVCTASEAAGGEICGSGIPGTGSGHFYHSGSLNWATEGSNSIAVGPAGRVYVGDYGRVQEFEPDGSFVGALTLADSEPQFVTALAVDSAGDIYERSAIYGSGGSPLQHQVPGVREYSSGHILLRTDDTEAGSEPNHVAVDGSDNLIVSDYNGGDFEFRAYKPDGTLFAFFISDQVKNIISSARPGGLAVDQSTGTIYATPFEFGSEPFGYVAVISPLVLGAPVVSEERAGDIQPSTATLHAVLNPSGFDTHYRFEYVDQESFANDGGFSSPNTQQTVEVDLGAIYHKYDVLSAISGLMLGTAYRYRIVAESECEPTLHPGHTCVTLGPAELFETLPAISVRNFVTQTVGPELVTLKAELNPNGGQSTVYTIHYGKASGNYSEGSARGSLTVGNEFNEVTATFTGLEPNTTYHYQLVASNSNDPGGEDTTTDQTFTTERSSAEERSAENCPNTNLREEDVSLSLPDCRAYEQVTPLAKEGSEAFPKFSLAPDGERVQFYSEGAFAGAEANELATEYVAGRGSSGWTSRAVLGRLAPVGFEPAPEDFETGFYSASLSKWLFLEIPAYSGEQSRVTATGAYYALGSDEGPFVDHWTPILQLVEGRPRSHFVFTEINGQSEDLARLFITTGARLLPSPQDERPDNPESGFTYHTRIYEIEGAGSGSPTMRLAAEVPLGFGQDRGSCTLDEERTIPRPARLTSSDGRTLLYTNPIEVNPLSGCGNGTPNGYGLYARIDRGAPIQLNVPPPSQCTGSAPCMTGAADMPRFYGVSPDGKYAWFTTAQPLINADTDATRDVYVAKLENGSLSELVQASAGGVTATHPTPGTGAGVVGIARVSADGTHVAYVATGVLTAKSNSEGDFAVQGSDNLYVYDVTTGATTFVARLCSAPEASGSSPDVSCPNDLGKGEGLGTGHNDAAIWNPETSNGEIAFTPDGHYLLIGSWGRLTGDDTDNVTDVYRFDVGSSELTRVSAGRNGNDASGNDDAYPASVPKTGEVGPKPFRLAEDEGRSMSSDGGVVIFTTSAPLVSHDTNEAPDYYEWEEGGHGTCSEPAGCVSLVSSGRDPHGSEVAIISASGRDIAFETQRGLAPNDTDGVGDIYDARTDGGFHVAHTPVSCGSPESCHVKPKGEPSGPVIASETFVGPPNGPTQLTCAKGRHRAKRHGQVRCVRKHGRHRRHHLSGGARHHKEEGRR